MSSGVDIQYYPRSPSRPLVAQLVFIESLIVLVGFLEHFGCRQFRRKGSMVTSIRRSSLDGLPVDHVVILDAIARYSKQDDQPHHFGKDC